MHGSPKFAFWLVVMLAASDVLSSIAMFITPSTDAACYFSGFLIHYAQVASFLWTTCIAYTLYNSIRLNFERVESAKLRMHIYGWGLPAVLAGLPLMSDKYERGNDAWCWIDVSGDEYVSGTTWRFTTFYVPLWAAMFYTFYVYRYIGTTVAGMQLTQQPDANFQKKMDRLRRLKW